MSQFGWGPFLGLNARGPLINDVKFKYMNPLSYVINFDRIIEDNVLIRYMKFL